MKASFIALLLISTTLSIKIKIRTPKNQTPSDSGAPLLTGGWNTERGCDPITDNVELGTLFSLYAEQIQSIVQDSVNELLLVKHESQVVAGTNHRLIFRVRDRETNDKLYFGFSLFVDLQGGVRITGYLESFDLAEVSQAMGFADERLFRYRCDNLSDSAVMGFNDWATELIGGNVSPVEPLDDFGFEPLPPAPVQYSSPPPPAPAPVQYVPAPVAPAPVQYVPTPVPRRRRRPRFNPAPVVIPPPVPQPVQYVPAPAPVDQFGGNDSPFEEKTINIKIRGTNPDGSKFLIGSAKPKKED